MAVDNPPHDVTVPGALPPGDWSTDVALPLDRVRREVDAVLGRFLDAQAEGPSGAQLARSIEVLRAFLRGGKRLRPLFCVCGWVAAGGSVDSVAVNKVAAALELFHSFALIHDDVMDASETRRGRPTVHRVLAADAGSSADPAGARRFGTSAAILLGDLCMVWSDELLHRSGVSAERLRAALPLIDTMRTELMAGQYLDVAPGDGMGADALERAWQVIRLKTAAYTVTRMLQIGATLAGADETLLRGCADYGLPLGEAFQLRDDLLGVFGATSVTGKSSLDDFRAGKRTVLMALTWQRAGAAERDVIHRLHGDPALGQDGAERLRAIIRHTGADRAVEDMIDERRGQALAAVRRAPMTAPARRSLTDLAEAATRRAS